jgi:hypothetical protein
MEEEDGRNDGAAMTDERLREILAQEYERGGAGWAADFARLPGNVTNIISAMRRAVTEARSSHHVDDRLPRGRAFRSPYKDSER